MIPGLGCVKHARRFLARRISRTVTPTDFRAGIARLGTGAEKYLGVLAGKSELMFMQRVGVWETWV